MYECVIYTKLLFIKENMFQEVQTQNYKNPVLSYKSNYSHLFMNVWWKINFFFVLRLIRSTLINQRNTNKEGCCQFRVTSWTIYNWIGLHNEGSCRFPGSGQFRLRSFHCKIVSCLEGENFISDSILNWIWCQSYKTYNAINLEKSRH